MAYEEVYPTVTCDVALGEKVAWLDIDIEQVRERMVEEGMTPEQIASTSIHFSADKAKGLGGSRTLGDYSPRKKEIRLFYEPMSAQARWNARDLNSQVTFSELSFVMSDTLLHEIKHRMNHATGLRKEHYQEDGFSGQKTSIGLLLGGVLCTGAAVAASFETVLPKDSWAYLNTSGLLLIATGIASMMPDNAISRRLGPSFSSEEASAHMYELTHDPTRGFVALALPLRQSSETCLE